MEFETEERRKRMKLAPGPAFEVIDFPLIQKLPPITEMVGQVNLPWIQSTVAVAPPPTITTPSLLPIIPIDTVICATCQHTIEKPRFRDGKPYCENDYVMQVQRFPTGMPLLTIRSHPENHQIANYNVYPAPVIALAKGLGASETMTALMVEGSSNYELQEGFQSGHVRVIKEGGNYIVFNGLKINKMGTVKKELRQHQIMKFDFFIIRFRMAGYSWDSRPFRLVSSCTQLPKEVRSRVRPSKRAVPGAQTNEFVENSDSTDSVDVELSQHHTTATSATPPPGSIQYLVD